MIFFCKLHGTQKAKSILDKQKIKRRESKHTAMENHFITADSKKEKKRIQSNQKRIR